MEREEYVHNTMDMVKKFLGDSKALDNVAETILDGINKEYDTSAQALEIVDGNPAKIEKPYDALVKFYEELSSGINQIREKNVEISSEI